MKQLPTTLARFLWHFVKKQMPYFVIIQILAFAWSFDNTIWPYILGQLIDKLSHFTGDKSLIWSHITPLLILWLSAWIITELAYRIVGFMIARVFPRFETDIRLSLFEYVQGHSYEFFANHFAGTISNRISDMTNSSTRILQLIMMLFLPAATAILIACVIFLTIQPQFAALLLGWCILHISICLLGAKNCSDRSNEHSDARSELTGKIVDSFSNIINVKMFARKRYECDYIAQFQTTERNKNVAAHIIAEKIKIALGVSAFLFPGVLLTWYIIHCWQLGQITVGDMVLIFNTTWNIQHLAWMVGLELPNLYQEIGTCDQALALVRAKHDIIDQPDAIPLQITRGKIEFDQVYFSYRKTHTVFNNLNLTIEAGSKVGLVGYSGSGKTTFVNLMMRFFDLESGEIRLDGTNIRNVTIESLRRQISMIPQDPSLFHRSLIDNIRYGKIDASLDEVIEAAKQAHCHDFVMKLPEGYNALVGERGIKLSGGQRQRIAIARAILENAPILILDEATSALDSVTEKHIQTALNQLMANRTTLVIAHRLSTLAAMDRILVFDRGRIIEDGTHDELLRLDGHYANMWRMQAGGFLPDQLADQVENAEE